ncbi:MAG: lambda exonuclease family protein [Terriglobales bacterium]
MIEIFRDLVQGSDEWRAARCGIPTSSDFDAILAKGKGGGESKMRRTLMLRLIGEQITGQPEESYSNGFLERGKAQEPDARNMYAFLHDEFEPEIVGFIRNGQIGCSPDSLLGPSGMLEIKTRMARLQLELLLAGEVPPEHKAQIQGQLLVAEREWVAFMSFSPGIKPFIAMVYRDEPYIARLKIEILDFLAEMETLKVRLTA